MDSIMKPGSQKPQTVGSEECRVALGVGRSCFYELAREDRLPVRTIRIGRQFRFSRRELERLLDGDRSHDD